MLARELRHLAGLEQFVVTKDAWLVRLDLRLGRHVGRQMFYCEHLLHFAGWPLFPWFIDRRICRANGSEAWDGTGLRRMTPQLPRAV
jgi:hypothetical protein